MGAGWGVGAEWWLGVMHVPTGPRAIHTAVQVSRMARSRMCYAVALTQVGKQGYPAVQHVQANAPPVCGLYPVRMHSRHVAYPDPRHGKQVVQGVVVVQAGGVVLRQERR